MTEAQIEPDSAQTAVHQAKDRRAQDRPVIAPALHHVTYLTNNLDEMVDFYCKVTGMIPVYYTEHGAWLSNDKANHRMALVCHPGLGAPANKPRSTGHHHTGFEYADFDQWLDNYIRLRDQGIVPFMALDHGPTLSLYYVDPDGNGVEIQVDNFRDWARSKEWMWASPEFFANPIGSWMDPEKVVLARQEGLSHEEIHRRAHRGDYLPHDPRTDVLLPDVLS